MVFPKTVLCKYHFAKSWNSKILWYWLLRFLTFYLCINTSIITFQVIFLKHWSSLKSVILSTWGVMSLAFSSYSLSELKTMDGSNSGVHYYRKIWTSLNSLEKALKITYNNLYYKINILLSSCAVSGSLRDFLTSVCQSFGQMVWLRFLLKKNSVFIFTIQYSIGFIGISHHTCTSARIKGV